MKKLFFLVIFVAIATSTQAASLLPPSGNTQFSRFVNFNTDTLAYLQYNFGEGDINSLGKVFYLGRPLNVLLEDLELSVMMSTSNEEFFNNDRGANSVTLIFIDRKSLTDKIISNRKYVKMEITFEVDITKIELDSINKSIATVYKNQNVESKIVWDFKLKPFYENRIVKDIIVRE